MDFYTANLAAFAILNTCLLLLQHRFRRSKAQGNRGFNTSNGRRMTNASTFQCCFLLIYALAVAADWLQGPYTYAIYKYEKQIPEDRVALLYAVGFISGGISAFFVGQLADRFGRRRICLAYCACYGVTCLSMLSDNFIMLSLGRVSGGFATTILYSVFETWMISDYHTQELDEESLPLGDVFSRITTTSGVVAICSGIIGDVLVGRYGSRICPFWASLSCCVGAAALMLLLWRENYGTPPSASKGSIADPRFKTLRNPSVIILGCAILAFEGTMYLFVFFWPAALKSTRVYSPETQVDLPFGLVFSCFMCAMMAGSTILSIGNNAPSLDRARSVLLLAFTLTIGCLATTTLFNQEHAMFYAFCLIEACVGAYFPSIALLKSETIGDGVRGSVYSLLRLPLNCFVVVVHAFDKEGGEHRNGVFLLCALLLIVATWSLKDARFERANGH